MDSRKYLLLAYLMALEWGLFDYAKGVLKNFLDYYWFPSGNVRYRGLEMAEVGRMLTQVAMYYRYTGDSFFIDYIDKINGSVNMLMSRYQNALKLPSNDSAYGIITGNDEADLWRVTIGGGHTEYPFYSISAETIRAFNDLGSVLIDIGKEKSKPDLSQLGNNMIKIAPSIMVNLRKSLNTARHSVGDNLYCLPYTAGTNVCTNIPHSSSIRVSEPWRYVHLFLVKHTSTICFPQLPVFPKCEIPAFPLKCVQSGQPLIKCS